MDWESAKAELEQLAGGHDNKLGVDDWTFYHYDPPLREAIFCASIHFGTKIVSAEGKNLRHVMDAIKIKIGIGNEKADPADQMGPEIREEVTA